MLAAALLLPHLDIVHAHQIATVVQVVFEVAVLKVREAQGSPSNAAASESRRKRCRTYEILKHQSEAAFGVDDVVKRDDVGVFQVLQQRHWMKHKVGTETLP